MGINKLKDVLKKHCPKALQTRPLTFFKGYRISVDASTVMYSTMASAWKQAVRSKKSMEDEVNKEIFYREWSRNILSLINRFLMAVITPVFVFDGKSPPEKDSTRQKRQAQINKYKTNYQNLFNAFMQASTMEKILIWQQAQKIEGYILPVNRENSDFFKTLLYIIGIPFLQAKEEADGLCAALCIAGHCYAQYTTDTDSLAHGCRCVITDFTQNTINEQGQAVETIEIIILSDILQGMVLSYDSFVDMCIMLGCDYNSNIPGIGPAKVVPLIKKYRTIENLPPVYAKKELDIAVLKHKASEDHRGCRNMFSAKSVVELSAEEMPDLNIVTGDIMVRLGQATLPVALDVSNILKIIEFVPKAKNVASGKDDFLIDDISGINFIIRPYEE